MELRAQFDKFLQDIRPGARHKEEWKTGSDTLRKRLLSDPNLSEIIVGSFLQGSVRRSTAVRPTGGKRSDVDVVIVTTIDYTLEKPNVAMKRFEPFLNKHYGGKWGPQDRSFSVELSYVDLDLVVTALPTDPQVREALKKLYATDAVQTLESLEERTDWRLSKSWNAEPASDAGFPQFLAEDQASEKDWRPHPLMLPDRAVAGWGPTHPLAQIKWTADKNRDCNGHYVNVVRAIKWWRHENEAALPKYPKGYPLEHTIGSVLPDGTETMAEGVTLAFEGIRDTFAADVAAGRVPVLRDHGVPTHDVMKRVSVEDFTKLHKVASEAALLARKAFESADVTESGALWQRLLGGSFPLPGPGGGDRSRGFTPPGGPAQPGKSERFA
jgi:hypothetical protein